MLASRLGMIAAVVVCAVYLLQLVTPLRLNLDSIVLLSSALSMADGKGYLYHGSRPLYPRGYPTVVALLEKLGIASSATLVGVNLLCLAIGLVSAYIVLRRSTGLSSLEASLALFGLAMSFLTVKHVTLPQTDVMFLGFSLAAVAVMTLADTPNMRARRMLILGALILILSATTVRSIAIALLPAWLMCITRIGSHHGVRRGDNASTAFRVRLVLCAVLLLMVLWWVLTSQTHYLKDALRIYTRTGHGTLSGVVQSAFIRLKELGEISLNVPLSRTPASIGGMCYVIGGCAMALIVWSLWIRRSVFTAADVYLASYVAIVYAYPLQSPRHWLPVIPLLIGCVIAPVRRWCRLRAVRTLVLFLATWFVFMGFVAMAYSTRISLAGQRFPEVYGDGKLRPAYDAAFRGKDLLGLKGANRDAYDILVRSRRTDLIDIPASATR